jgi:hypothetical protein
MNNKLVVVPFEKYQKLMERSKMILEENIKTDIPDGQCISHNHNVEINRDVNKEWALNLAGFKRAEEQEEEPKQEENKFSMKVGAGDVNLALDAERNKISVPELKRLSPPGRRIKKKNKLKHHSNWKTFD